MKLNDKEIYSAIAKARKSKNISQQELSRMTGIIQADISRIENGKANPTINVITRLADALGISLNFSIDN